MTTPADHAETANGSLLEHLDGVSATDLDAAIHAHDRAATGPTAIWLGAEPTFTDRGSESPEWLSEALGPEKEERARRLLGLLAARHPGAVVLRTLGRQYPGESEPRWSYGLYARRDGRPLWSGPPDTFDDGGGAEPDVELTSRFRSAVLAALRQAGWFAAAVAHPDATCLRLVCRPDGEEASSDPEEDMRLARPSVHQGAIPPSGLVDEVALDGSYLVLLHARGGAPQTNALWVELPAFAQVAEMLTFLDVLGRVASALSVRALGLRGFPPPVDDTVAWTTLTPDPAVLEVNQAPEPDMASFHRASRTLFALAAEVGLSPYRLHYDGSVSDSGGGGQLTFGGRSPAASPFFATPRLLPRLIRYLVRHPALSYWFATQYVGEWSQSPRPDEGVRDTFLELDVALDQLAHADAPSPETLWGTLRHFLADSSGNPHRSELNIEKLHNRFLPGRGCLGLVELRALSMPRSATVATARAMLFRSLLVMLARQDVVPGLVHWGDELHDRFALPFFLRRDLDEVLADLRRAGLGLGAAVEDLLLRRDAVVLGHAECAGHRLTLQKALEFWPLVGDAASQEGGGSRLVDASTSRVQVRIDATTAGADDLEALQLAVKGHVVPLRTEESVHGPTRLLGLRFRSFVPWTGLHPEMGAEGPLALTLRHRGGEAVRVTLHPWRPDGEAYDGLPRDLEEAAARRAERVVVERLDGAVLPPAREPPPRATTPYCLDLRRLVGG